MGSHSTTTVLLAKKWHHKYFKYELFWCVLCARAALSIHSTFIKCIVNEAASIVEATKQFCVCYALSVYPYNIQECVE